MSCEFQVWPGAGDGGGGIHSSHFIGGGFNLFRRQSSVRQHRGLWRKSRLPLQGWMRTHHRAGGRTELSAPPAQEGASPGRWSPGPGRAAPGSCGALPAATGCWLAGSSSSAPAGL